MKRIYIPIVITLLVCLLAGCHNGDTPPEGALPDAPPQETLPDAPPQETLPATEPSAAPDTVPETEPGTEGDTKPETFPEVALPFTPSQKICPSSRSTRTESSLSPRTTWT